MICINVIDTVLVVLPVLWLAATAWLSMRIGDLEGDIHRAKMVLRNEFREEFKKRESK